MRPSALTKAMSSAAGTFCMWNWVWISRPKSKRMRFRSISCGVAHWKPAACCSVVSATLTRRAMVWPPASSVTMLHRHRGEGLAPALARGRPAPSAPGGGERPGSAGEDGRRRARGAARRAPRRSSEAEREDHERGQHDGAAGGQAQVVGGDEARRRPSTSAIAMAMAMAWRKLRPSAKPVSVGITIMALTRSTPTMRMATTVVSAVSSVSIRLSAATGTPLVRARSSLRVMAKSCR